jgi:hypothetical protein
MKLKPFCILLSLGSLLLWLPVGQAQTAPAAGVPSELPLVVVEVAGRQTGAITDFDRLDMAFQRVARERQWPVTIVGERFASNTPTYQNEVRVYHRPLRQDTPQDLTFRSWVTATVNGVEHDLGIITHRHYRRAGEHHDDMLDRIFRGAAEATADRLELLFFGGSPRPAR